MSFNNVRVAIFALLLFFLSLSAGFLLMRQTQVHESISEICDLVEEKFYLNDDNLEQWTKNCQKMARKVSIFSSRTQLNKLLQDQMDQMHVSHFLIYTPDEEQKLWKGQAVETGLKCRWMEDHLVVYQIVPSSPAVAAGFRLGDELLKIDGREADDPEMAAVRSGRYLVLRDKKEIEIKLDSAAIQVDFKPTLDKLDGQTALLTLSSFRSEYFADADWKKFAQNWTHYSKLIVDLRENAGGNMVAMLRALSPFFCQPTTIGDLALPRRSKEGERYAMINDLSDDEQIEEVESASGVALETFPGYGCFRGAVIVLVGPHTSSVSEIFASAMSHRPRAVVMGQPTSGDVVLAVWYELPAFGPGYSISIPEALYMTTEGKVLEGKGVFPQRELFDDLNIWRQGKDSWIQAARAAHL